MPDLNSRSDKKWSGFITFPTLVTYFEDFMDHSVFSMCSIEPKWGQCGILLVSWNVSHTKLVKSHMVSLIAHTAPWRSLQGAWSRHLLSFNLFQPHKLIVHAVNCHDFCMARRKIIQGHRSESQVPYNVHVQFSQKQPENSSYGAWEWIVSVALNQVLAFHV